MSSVELSPGIDSRVGLDMLMVALIGPDEQRRRIVAGALAETRRADVREFDSYPPEMERLQSFLESFDVVMLDLDSDPNLALQLVTRASAVNSATVMVYSENADPSLAVKFMRAGASDYILLPLEQGALHEALHRAESLVVQKTVRKPLGKLLVFVGSKGGSGVTTVACNVAFALAQNPEQNTLLIDLALPIGDAALGLGITARYSTEDALQSIDRLDPSLLQKLLVKHKSGVCVLAGPSEVSETEVSKDAIDKLIAVARREFDHVIVDVGSRIDVAAKALFSQASTIYLVTQTGISELRNSNRLISQFFAQVGPKLEVVINRFEPHFLDAMNEDVILKALGRPVQWKIPDDQDAARALKNGEARLADTRVARTASEIASSVTGRPVQPEKKKGLDLKWRAKEAAEPVPISEEPPKLSIVPPSNSRVKPSIEWNNPEPIFFGSPLTKEQLNATASVPGKFIYTPAPGYKLPPGTHTLWVTFTPSGSESEEPLQTSVSIAVLKSTPPLAWLAPAHITYGVALDDSQLNATSSVPGSFEYSPGRGVVLPVGTHSISVKFTPADHDRFGVTQAAVPLTVEKAIPQVEWQAPTSVPSDTVLGPSLLNAVASVPGAFYYSPGEGEVLKAGTHTLSLTFTPNDSANFAPVTTTVTVHAAKAKPVVTWQPPESMIYGAALSARQLCAASSVDGNFEYTPSLGAMLAAGEHTLMAVFTPQDVSTYEPARIAVPLVVAKATPAISWAEPAPISVGTALSEAQLNAIARVPGNFKYSVAHGQIMNAGAHTVTVTFTPADTINYTPAQASIVIKVTEKQPVQISWNPPSAIRYGTVLSAAQLNARASAPGTFIYSPSEGHILAPGKHTLVAKFTPADESNYADASVEVLLEVDPLTDISSSPATTAPAHSSRPAAMPASARVDEAAAKERSPRLATMAKPRETRTYKGAIYEKGDDGQWHLQQK